MPKRPTSFRRDSDSGNTRIQISDQPFVQQVVAFCQKKEVRCIAGILLITFAGVLLLSYISFFFTGKMDESALGMSGSDQEIHNVLGVPGAHLGHFLINQTFGYSSLIAVILIGFFGFKLLKKLQSQSSMRWLVCGSFMLIWSSILLGFIRNLVNNDSFFWWGGKYGQQIAKSMTDYTHVLGTIIILVVSLTIFLVLADPNFISRVQRLIAEVKERISRPSRREEESSETDVMPDLGAENEPVAGGDIVAEDISEPFSIEIEDVPSAPETEDPAKDVEFVVQTHDDDMVVDNTEEVVPIEEASSDGTIGVEINDVAPVDMADQNSAEDLLEKLGPYDPRKDLENYKFPPLTLLRTYDNESAPVINQQEQQANANRIVTTLRNYGIEIDSIKATVGPTVTLYEVVPKAGIRIVKIQNLENDIMMSLSATGIRIIAPMPGKGTVGIEVPNENPQTVSMHSVLASKRFQEEKKMRLPVAIGRTITNDVFMFDLAKTPHLLVAGATGQGKSVAINAIITSLLYKKHPAELKLVLVDPKMVEFAPYKPLLRHYLAAMPETDPEKVIITDCSEVINTLNSLVIEMENRYKLLMDAGVRNLEDYNEKFVSRKLNPQKLVGESLHHQFLPYIVIVIDEYGDFIMQVGKQVETPIARITQKARAVGMHMILATQRPSVNIVTGVIKANIPTRIALRTQSVIDSRTVLDAKGADQLIGRGDMLYSGNGNITRIQCAFVDTPEVDSIVEHISTQQRYSEPYPLPEYVPEGSDGDSAASGNVDVKHLDALFAEAARYVVSKQEGSTSRLQRAFEIGYNRAGKLSDQLEEARIVGPNKGPKGRDVLIQDMDTLEQLLQQLGA